MTSEIVFFHGYWNSAFQTPRCPLNRLWGILRPYFCVLTLILWSWPLTMTFTCTLLTLTADVIFDKKDKKHSFDVFILPQPDTKTRTNRHIWTIILSLPLVGEVIKMLPSYLKCITNMSQYEMIPQFKLPFFHHPLIKWFSVTEGKLYHLVFSFKTLSFNLNTFKMH